MSSDLSGVNQRPDPDIARDIAAELKNWLPDTRESIKPEVRHGRVTLEGEVERHYQRASAELSVRRIKGVTGVNNRVRVKPRLGPSATGIRHRTEEAFRHSALNDANRAVVEANGGAVVLKGTVRSWAERQEAERTLGRSCASSR